MSKENQGKLGINFDMNVLSNTLGNSFGKTTDKDNDDNKQIDNNSSNNNNNKQNDNNSSNNKNDNQSDKNSSNNNNIQESLSNLVNNIANSVDNMEAQDSSEGSAIEDNKIEAETKKHLQKKEEPNTENKLNLEVSLPLEDIVSKIKVNDGYPEDGNNSEMLKETFGMTEALMAKPMESSEQASEDEQIDKNDGNDSNDSSNKSKQKKKQIQNPDDDEENIVQYSDEQLDEAFELFKKDKTLPPFLMRDAVIDYARRQSLQFMVDENYDAAYNNDITVNDLLLEYSRDCGGYTTESITRNLESRIEMAKEQRQASNQKYQKRISLLKENEQKKLQQLIEIQACERKQFELDCQSPEFLQRFSKPSKKLLQVRKIQKALALAHKFDEAKTIKMEGDVLQRSETLQAKRCAIRYIKSSYQKLLEKQQHQLDCAAENRDRKIRALLGQLERENIANQKLTKQLEQRLKESKSKKASSLPPLTSNGVKKAPSKSTLRQLADYKSTQRISMLNVKLTNIQKIVGNVKPSMKPIKIV